jgi:hypothetical protein
MPMGDLGGRVPPATLPTRPAGNTSTGSRPGTSTTTSAFPKLFEYAATTVHRATPAEAE